jgi:hypothetical protein
MAVRSLIIVCAALLLSGCLVNSSTRTEYSRRHISCETVKQIEPGKSKSDFVLAVLGDPTSKNKLDDGSEVWKWEHKKSTPAAARSSCSSTPTTTPNLKAQLTL